MGRGKEEVDEKEEYGRREGEGGRGGGGKEGRSMRRRTGGGRDGRWRREGWEEGRRGGGKRLGGRGGVRGGRCLEEGEEENVAIIINTSYILTPHWKIICNIRNIYYYKLADR